MSAVDLMHSVDHIGVVPWSLFTWGLWLFVHCIYKKTFQTLLERISIKEPIRRRLVQTYWNIAFTAITIPFAFENLQLTVDDVRSSLYTILEMNAPKWFTREPSLSMQTKLSYILLTGFFLNNVCEVSIEKGLNNLDFMSSELLTLFFVSTFPLRCVLYGIAFTTVVNIVKFVLELSKLFYCFSKIIETEFVKFFTRIVLFLHCVLWVSVFLHIVPQYFLLTAFRPTMGDDGDLTHVSSFLLLNVALWGFYLIEIVHSPFSRILLNLVLGKPIEIEELLFGPDLRVMEPEEVNQGCDGTAECCTGRNNVEEVKPPPNDEPKKNLRVLYHTVKCYIRMKRKLNRIREQREALKAAKEPLEEEPLEEEPSESDENPCEADT